MIVILVMSLLFIVYGAVGYFKGIQKIPQKFKNTEYEKPYRRFQSCANLMLGVSFFFCWLIAKNEITASENMILICAVFILPIILYAIIGHLLFCKRLKK